MQEHFGEANTLRPNNALSLGPNVTMTEYLLAILIAATILTITPGTDTALMLRAAAGGQCAWFEALLCRAPHHDEEF